MGEVSTFRRAFGLTALAALASACGFSGLEGLSGGEDPLIDDGGSAESSSLDDGGAQDRSMPDEPTAREESVVDVAVEPTVDVSNAVDAQDQGPMPIEADAPVMPVDAALPGCDGGCGAGSYCAGTECAYPSCGDRLAAVPRSPSAVYLIDPDGPGGAAPFRAFCEMVLDGGGWTLILKVDGTRTTFVFGSPRWEDADTFQPNAPDLDATEAKLASFSTIPFTSLRLGMVQGGTTRWLVVGVRGPSLMSLMTSGYHPTGVGRNAWERLPSRGSLQSNCNREGINVRTQLASARIGIVANNQNDCQTCDSWIAFGGMADLTGEAACGNFAVSTADNGTRQDALFGYVMAR